MTQKNRLTTVPDTALLSFCRGLMSFLTDEAQVRGWQDVSERLKAVEAALTARGGGDTGLWPDGTPSPVRVL